MKMETSQLPSNFQIDDLVTFLPMSHQILDLALDEEWRDGTVIAVRFTKRKVFYDILDEHMGVIFNNVDSANVRALGDYPDDEEEYDDDTYN